MKKNIQITDSDHSSIAAKELNTYKHSDPDVQNDPSVTVCWPMQTFICRGGGRLRSGQVHAPRAPASEEGLGRLFERHRGGLQEPMFFLTFILTFG